MFSPTLKRTVTRDWPGWLAEYTYFTPGIPQTSFSIGVVTRSSTSLALAPGIVTKTSIIGTTICGSSSCLHAITLPQLVDLRDGNAIARIEPGKHAHPVPVFFFARFHQAIIQHSLRVGHKDPYQLTFASKRTFGNDHGPGLSNRKLRGPVAATLTGAAGRKTDFDGKSSAGGIRRRNDFGNSALIRLVAHRHRDRLSRPDAV